MDKEIIDKLKKAGSIAIQAKVFARSLIKHGMPLLEIAQKIESKIIELGGKPAFPVNLSKNEIAAHATPSYNDTDTASGLLKVDIGVHIDGYAADTAFSLDLEDNEENRKLITAAESALAAALEHIRKGIHIRQIGAIIKKAIESHGAAPIHNLSGHSIEQYNLHAGMNIPNYDNSQEIKLGEGIYAIEPFATNGAGSVRDGRPSGIYSLQKSGVLREPFAREILEFIEEEYETLPFCARWLHAKFGTRALLALKRMEDAGILHHYALLVETQKGRVAQAEHTIVITDTEVIVTTK